MMKPAWMDSFTYTWDFLQLGKDKFRIVWKDFPAGKVTLGGNSGAKGHMYVVFVEPMGTTGAARIVARPDVRDLPWELASSLGDHAAASAQPAPTGGGL